MNITTHFAGPVKDNWTPYYPIKVREKLAKDEVQPIQGLTSQEALNYLVKREHRSWSRFKGAGDGMSGSGFSLR